MGCIEKNFRLDLTFPTPSYVKFLNYLTTVSKLWKTGILPLRQGCRITIASGFRGQRHRNIKQFNKLLWGGETVWCWVLRPVALARTIRGFAQRAIVHRPSLTPRVARGAFPGGAGTTDENWSACYILRRIYRPCFEGQAEGGNRRTSRHSHRIPIGRFSQRSPREAGAD